MSILAAARDAVERALAIEPDLPDALFARATIETNFDYNWNGAAETLRKALALAPQDPALLMRGGKSCRCSRRNHAGSSIFSAGR